MSLLLSELLEGAGSRADRCMWHCGSFLHKGQNVRSYGSAQWTSNPANLHVSQRWTDAAVFPSCSDGVNGGVFLNTRSQVSLSVTQSFSCMLASMGSWWEGSCDSHGPCLVYMQKAPRKKASPWGQHQAHFMQLGTHSQNAC